VSVRSGIRAVHQLERASQQAARVAPTASSSGRSRLQRAIARLHRGWNAQPAGNRIEPRHHPVDLRQALALLDDRRDRAHEAQRVGMRRAVDDVGDRADLDDASRVHHGDTVRGLRDHSHVVGDQHHRGAVVAAQPLQQLDDLRLDRHVERRRRLVGDHEPRAPGQRQRNHDALPHPARELVRIVVEAPCRRGNADLVQKLDRARPRLLGRQRQVRGDRLDQLRADRVERIQRGERILEDRADLAPRIARIAS
jgi:hypothetical protein